MGYISQDRTFCKKADCTKTKCDRHRCHIDWSIAPPWRSFAAFEGTQYCLKNKKKNKKKGGAE